MLNAGGAHGYGLIRKEYMDNKLKYNHGNCFENNHIETVEYCILNCLCPAIHLVFALCLQFIRSLVTNK